MADTPESLAEIWCHYASLFRECSTASISPELLAALAQAENAGNPVASTYWRWRLTRNPFVSYQPASSSVGIYQMTDAQACTRLLPGMRHPALLHLARSLPSTTWLVSFGRSLLISKSKASCFSMIVT
jgi:hypothetical protein